MSETLTGRLHRGRGLLGRAACVGSALVAAVDGRRGVAVTAPPAAAPAQELEPAGGRCPDCASPRVADEGFCEACGYSFLAGTSGPAGPPPPATPQAWEALVSADREHFERVAASGIDFPGDSEQRRLALDGQELRIGRGGDSADTRPEIDLGGPGGDPAVSRLHATLVRQDDGSYAIVDKGSTNGTSINEAPTPIAANVAITLADGDRLHLGAWTTITVRRVCAAAR